jgi:hypothetical protein
MFLEGGVACCERWSILSRLTESCRCSLIHDRQSALRQAPVAERPIALPPVTGRSPCLNLNLFFVSFKSSNGRNANDVGAR